MDRKILPAFLNLKNEFFFWNDSFYSPAAKSHTSNFFLRFKNQIQNVVYRTKFSLYNDHLMPNIPLTSLKDLPPNCVHLDGEPNSNITNLMPTKNLFNKEYEIVLLGDYEFYDLSRKCNIIKLIDLINDLNLRYPDKVYYKPHPGSVGSSHLKYFGRNIIEDFIPIEMIGNNCRVIMTIGSASVVNLKKTVAKVIGIGNLVDLCNDLYETSERQGLKHIKDLEAFHKKIDQELK